jgi:hypothetical protein
MLMSDSESPEESSLREMRSWATNRNTITDNRTYLRVIVLGRPRPRPTEERNLTWAPRPRRASAFLIELISYLPTSFTRGRSSLAHMANYHRYISCLQWRSVSASESRAKYQKNLTSFKQWKGHHEIRWKQSEFPVELMSSRTYF